MDPLNGPTNWQLQQNNDYEDCILYIMFLMF